MLSILTSCKTSNLFVEENTRNTVQDLDSVFLSNNKYEYQIRIDDKITISVWGQDEFSVDPLMEFIIQMRFMENGSWWMQKEI